MKVYLITITLISLARIAHAGAGSGQEEFLICERPAQLVVLNRYQQSLTPNEKTLLQPFVPMKILRSQDLLGDGFTPCMRIELNGAVCFLVRENSIRLAGAARAGEIRTYLGSALPRDTVHILKAGGLQFSAADGAREDILAAGERIVRFFTRDNQTYVRRSAGTHSYGWVNLSPGAEDRLWTLAHVAPSVGSAVPVRIIDSVQASLARTNILLSNLFAYFNGRTSRRLATPRWQLEPEGTVLRCTLVGGSPERDFPESTRYLVRELENHVLGTDLEVHAYPEGIEIRPK
jgi:hypothetical protein